MRIGVIAVPEAFDSALASVLDVLHIADALRLVVDGHIPQDRGRDCRRWKHGQDGAQIHGSRRAAAAAYQALRR